MSECFSVVTTVVFFLMTLDDCVIFRVRSVFIATSASYCCLGRCQSSFPSTGCFEVYSVITQAVIFQIFAMVHLLLEKSLLITIIAIYASSPLYSISSRGGTGNKGFCGICAVSSFLETFNLQYCDLIPCFNFCFLKSCTI